MTALSVLFFLPAMIILAVIVNFLIRKPYYAPAFYYLCVFLRERLLESMQVRYEVMIQLVVIVFCIACGYISYYRARRGYRFQEEYCAAPKIPMIEKGIIFAGLIVVFEAFSGVMNGYRTFDILVDIYKVLEIFIFYFFHRYAWRSISQMERCFNAIVFEMCIFGIVEMFITERGGVGINIAVTYAPLFLSTEIYKKNRYAGLVILITGLIFLISKTRTYMIGFILGVLVVLLLGRGSNKRNTVKKGLVLFVSFGVLLGIYMVFVGNDYLATLLNRILALRNGFEVAGGYRFAEIQMALKKFLDAPLVGKGYGYVEYVYLRTLGWANWGAFMHNSYVEILAKTGVLGACVYGACILKYLFSQFSLIRNELINKRRAYLVGGFAGTLSWMLISFAAPLSSYGYVFLPGIVALLYYDLYREQKSAGII